MARRKKTQERAEEIRLQAELDPLRDFEGSPAELFVARVAYWIRSHLKEVGIGLGVVVLAVGAWIGYTLYQEQRREQARIAFEELLEDPVMQPGSGAGEIAVEKLEAFKEEWGGSNIAKRVAVYEMRFLAEEEDFAAAAEQAMFLGGEASAPEIAAFFFVHAGYYFERAGQPAPQETAFGRAVEELRQDNLLKAEALFGQGRALITMGKREQGVAALRSMMEFDDVSVGGSDLRLRALAYLLQTRADAGE